MEKHANIKEEYRLLKFYEIRNHFGANALKNGPERLLNHNMYWALTKKKRESWKETKEKDRGIKVIDFNGDISDIKNAKETIKELQKKLNEKGYLMSSELGWPVISDNPFKYSEDYKVIKVTDDGTVLIDWEVK